jgi:catalase
MKQEKESSHKLTTRTGTLVPDNQNIETAGVRGPALFRICGC